MPKTKPTPRAELDDDEKQSKPPGFVVPRFEKNGPPGFATKDGMPVPISRGRGRPPKKP